MDQLICRSRTRIATEAEEQSLHEWRQASRENDEYYRDLVRLLETAEFIVRDVSVPPPPPVRALISASGSPTSPARLRFSDWLSGSRE
jgi:ferric-dicitrate binding protein FerR (iron transport regulator)